MDLNNVEKEPQLVGYDWCLKAIFGTNTMVAHPPPPLIEVDFHLCNASNYDAKLSNVTETVKFEMNNSELKSLISVLEKTINNG